MASEPGLPLFLRFRDCELAFGHDEIGLLRDREGLMVSCELVVEPRDLLCRRCPRFRHRLLGEPGRLILPVELWLVAIEHVRMILGLGGRADPDEIDVPYQLAE